MINVAKHLNVAKYNKIENRLRTLGIGVMVGFAGIAAVMIWLG